MAAFRKKPISVEEARIRMADLCSRSEQCTGEILEKLHKSGLPYEASRKIVEELKERGFIDDSRFAHAYAGDKLRFSGWGPMKIRMGLIAKRVDNSVISEALAELPKEEVYSIAFKVGKAKSRNLDIDDRNDRMKLMRYLASRGFMAETCSNVAKELSIESSES